MITDVLKILRSISHPCCRHYIAQKWCKGTLEGVGKEVERLAYHIHMAHKGVQPFGGGGSPAVSLPLALSTSQSTTCDLQ